MCADLKPDNTSPADDKFISLGTGLAPGSALGTTPPFVLWNPGNSLYYADIEASIVSWLAGGLGSGCVFACVNRQYNDPGGTTMTPVNMFSAGSLCPSIVSKTSASLAETATVIRPVSQFGSFVAATAWPPDPVLEVPFAYTLAPGYALSLQSVGTNSGAMNFGFRFKIRKIKT